MKNHQHCQFLGYESNRANETNLSLVIEFPFTAAKMTLMVGEWRALNRFAIPDPPLPPSLGASHQTHCSQAAPWHFCVSQAVIRVYEFPTSRFAPPNTHKHRLAAHCLIHYL